MKQKTDTPWQKNIPQLLTTPETLRSVFSNQNEEEPVSPTSYAVVAAFDFGHIVTRRFFAALQCLAERTNAIRLLVATIDPDPIEYYLQNFGVVPVVAISVGASDQEFIHGLHWGPAEGGADSIATHAEKIVILNDNMSWVVVGERRFELARLFVRRDVIPLKTQECFPSEWRYDQADLLVSLMDVGLDRPQAQIVADQLTT